QETPTAEAPDQATQQTSRSRDSDHCIAAERGSQSTTRLLRGQYPTERIGLDAPVDEAREPLVSGLVRPLLGRRLHQVCRGGEERALDAAVHGDLAGANGIDDDAGRVGRVPHLQLELEVDRLIAEGAALEPD